MQVGDLVRIKKSHNGTFAGCEGKVTQVASYDKDWLCRVQVGVNCHKNFLASDLELVDEKKDKNVSLKAGDRVRVVGHSELWNGTTGKVKEKQQGGWYVVNDTNDNTLYFPEKQLEKIAQFQAGDRVKVLKDACIPSKGLIGTVHSQDSEDVYKVKLDELNPQQFYWFNESILVAYDFTDEDLKKADQVGKSVQLVSATAPVGDVPTLNSFVLARVIFRPILSFKLEKAYDKSLKKVTQQIKMNQIKDDLVKQAFEDNANAANNSENFSLLLGAVTGGASVGLASNLGKDWLSDDDEIVF